MEKLGKLLLDNSRVSACLVRNLYATGAGRAVAGPDKQTVADLTKAFVAGGHRVPALMKFMALDERLYTALPAPPKPANITVAALGGENSSRIKEARQ